MTTSSNLFKHFNDISDFFEHCNTNEIITCKHFNGPVDIRLFYDLVNTSTLENQIVYGTTSKKIIDCLYISVPSKNNDILNYIINCIATYKDIKKLAIRSAEPIDLRFLSNLSNLEGLVIDVNAQKVFPREILSIKKLKYLYIYNAGFYEMPLVFNDFSELTLLDISTSSISYISSFNKNLTHIYLSNNNNLEVLPDNIDEVKNLHFLNISNTPIKAIPVSIIGLHHLKYLYMSNTKVYDLEHLFELSFLMLDISNGRYRYFTSGFLNSEVLFENVILDEMNIQHFYNRPLSEIEYFFKELDKEKVRMNEVRVIFIGDGDAGKSSIVHRLINGEHLENLKRTGGIAITRWETSIAEELLAINVWDFGGQEIMHSMHNYFLGENCVYVIVLDGRKDEEAEKWIDLVQIYGRNSHIIVVMNKIDDNENAEIDMFRLNSIYSSSFSSIHYHHISCKEGDNFDNFKANLIRTVIETESYKRVFPASWNEVRIALRDLRNEYGDSINYINEDDYISLCVKSGIEDDISQTILLKWMNDFGVCFSYRSKTRNGIVEDTKVLRPEWITNGIYKIINSRLVREANGFVPHDDIKIILEKEDQVNIKYRNLERDFILGMMREFDYSYPIDNMEFFPMLTSKNQPEKLLFDPSFEGNICYRLCFENNLPKTILYNFVVNMKDNVVREKTWQNGVSLECDNIYSLVAFGKDVKELNIYVHGTQSESADYLRYLLRAIKSLIKNLPVNYTEYYIWSTKGKTAKISIKRAIKMLEKNLETDYIEEIDETVSILDILQHFKPQFIIDKLHDIINERKTGGNVGSMSSFHIDDALISRLESLDRNVVEILQHKRSIDVEAMNVIGKNDEIKSCLQDLRREIGDKHELNQLIRETYDALQRSSTATIKRKLFEVISLTANIATLSVHPTFISLLELLFA